MSLTSINVNNTLVTRVDSEPTAGNKNLVKSGGICISTQNIETNILALSEMQVFKGWLNNTGDIVDYGQSTFCVISVKGGDIVDKPYYEHSNVMIVKSFNFYYKLSYAPDYATGETGRRDTLNNFKLPQDAKYLLISATIDNGGSVLPLKLTINGVDYVKPLRRKLDDYINTTNSLMLGSMTTFNMLPDYKGYLDGTAQILDFGNSTFKVIKINGGDKIQTFGASDRRYFIVKSFNFNYSFPYVPDFATGQDSLIYNDSTPHFAAPDAQYLLLQNLGDDNDWLPSKLYINDVCYARNATIANTILDVLRKYDQFMPLMTYRQYNGWIDSSNKILDYDGGKFVVIPVTGGQSIHVSTKSKGAYFFIVKSFNGITEYPYIPDLATGETGRRLVYGTLSLTLPNDSKFLLWAIYLDQFQYIKQNELIIDGYDIYNGSISELVKLKDKLTSENVPAYWLNTLTNKEATVNELNQQAGKTCISFVWFTDYHQSTNNKVSPALINHILEHTSIHMAVYTGDTTDGIGDSAQCIAAVRTFVNTMKPISMLSARGNHDVHPTAVTSQSDVVNEITDGEYYDMFIRPIEHIVNTERNLYYCYDDISQKFRYIILDTGDVVSSPLNATQLAWLQNRLVELETGWSVTIFSHFGAYSMYSYPNNMEESDKIVGVDNYGLAIVNAIHEVFNNLNCTIVALFLGHVHVDWICQSGDTYYPQNADGYPIITCTTDSGGANSSWYDWKTPNRPAGTTEEQAFDVVTINMSTRTIHLTRIGAGQDRTVEY